MAETAGAASRPKLLVTRPFNWDVTKHWTALVHAQRLPHDRYRAVAGDDADATQWKISDLTWKPGARWALAIASATRCRWVVSSEVGYCPRLTTAAALALSPWM